jgi:hypothetical protein
MSSEDAPRSIQGNPPTEPKSQPTRQDQSNPDVKIGDGSKDDHENPTEYHPQRPDEQPGWRGRLAKIRNFFIRPAEFWIALFTFVLAAETAIALRISNNTDEAVYNSAQAANEANKLNLAGLRPWVTVGIDIAGPLTFDDRGAHLQLNMSIQNVGRSPARSVLLGARIVPKGANEAILERDKFCDQLRKSESLPWSSESGFFLFPN